MPMFSLAPAIFDVIFYVGITTAVYCSILSLFQNDLKKIFACLTCSQLGFVFSVLGLQSVSGALLYLVVTSLAIAFLFLLSGIVVALTDTQDIRYMGELRKSNPLLAVFYLIGIISLSGVFFSGMLPKLQILNLFIKNGYFIEYGFMMFTTFITTICCAKTYLLIFEGEKKYQDKPVKILLPVKISVWMSAILTAFLGFIISSKFPVLFEVYTKNQLSLKGIFIFFVINLFATGLCLVLYKYKKLSDIVPCKISRFFEEGFIINKIYRFFINYIYEPLCKIVALVDKYVVNGFVKIISITVKLFGVLVSKMQTGSLQSYLLGSLLGIITAIGLVVFYYFKIKGF